MTRTERLLRLARLRGDLPAVWMLTARLDRERMPEGELRAMDGNR